MQRKKNGDDSKNIISVLKAVAHPVRLKIIETLCQGEHSVGALAKTVGSSQAIVSQQLRILRMHALVDFHWEDRRSYYFLLEPQLKKLIHCVRSCHKK